MKAIYKWTIYGEDQVIKTSPVEKWLDAQFQDGELVVWGIVDLDKAEVEYYLYTLWTGWPCKRIPGDYIGTVQIDNLVEHVFATRVHRPENVDIGWMDPENREEFYVS